MRITNQNLEGQHRSEGFGIRWVIITGCRRRVVGQECRGYAQALERVRKKGHGTGRFAAGERHK